jgi:hypothetical protein
MTKLLTPEELSELWKIPVETLNTMRSRPPEGKEPLPFVKIGRLVRYPVDKLEKWLERNTFDDVQQEKRSRRSS